MIKMFCSSCGERMLNLETRNTEDHDVVYRKQRCKKCGKLAFTMEVEIEDNEQFRNEWNGLARSRKNYKAMKKLHNEGIEDE